MANSKHVRGHGFARSGAVVVKHANQKSVGTSPKRTPSNGFFNPGDAKATRSALLYQTGNYGPGK
jgi:hypothetical protein